MTATPSAAPSRATLSHAARAQVAGADWGELTWFANAELGNSDALTVGRCVLRPGHENPRHQHPNCDEVLVVLAGRIRHTLACGEDAEMGPGDTISIPAGMVHRALNIGGDDAVLLIAFTSARREVVGE
jgi:quercetin dioxygenase-like cupin family protein